MRYAFSILIISVLLAGASPLCARGVGGGGGMRRSGTSGIGGRFRDWQDTFAWITFETSNENAGSGSFADTPSQEPIWTVSTTRAWVR